MAYSVEEKENILNSIFKDVEEGMATRKAIKKNKISSKTFFEWVDADRDKVKQYAQATENRTELKFESIEADYSEEPQRDPETGRIDTGWVQLQRLKIDAKKWELAKLMPKKYGDRTTIAGDAESPLAVNVINLGEGTKPDEATTKTE